MTNATRPPIVGPAFDSDRMNWSERCAEYASEIWYYLMDGRSDYVRQIYNDLTRYAWAWSSDNPNPPENLLDCTLGVMHEADTVLTEYGQDTCAYLQYGAFPDSGDVGFYYAVETAIEDSDLQVADLADIPVDFTGQCAVVNDHGNVSVYSVINGEHSLIFECV